MNVPKVTIRLTDEQFSQLGMIRAQAIRAESEGLPGMMVGQLWDHQVVFMFISNSQAADMQRLYGGVEPGTISRTGYPEDAPEEPTE